MVGKKQKNIEDVKVVKQKAFLTYSRFIGENIALTQGAGGNTSFKQGDSMWVKASGTWLKDAMKQNIFVEVDLKSIKQDFIGTKLRDLNAYKLDDSELRPSIETLLHAILDKKYVVHVHALDVLAYAVQKNGESQLTSIFKDYDIPWTWVQYAKPGEELANEVLKQLNAKPNTNVFVLANHGVIVAHNELEKLDKLLNKFVEICRDSLPEKATSNLKFPVLNNNEEAVDNYNLSEDFSYVAFDKKLVDVFKKGVLYPDQVIFLGCQCPVLESSNIVPDSIPFYIIPNKGMYIQKTISKGAFEQLHAHVLLSRKIYNTNAIKVLDETQIDELIHWDAEKYRKSIEK